MVGLLTLFAAALAFIVSVLAVLVAMETMRPRRRTAAWAVARSLPVDPGEVAMPFEEWMLDRPDGARLPVWEIQTSRHRNVETSDEETAEGISSDVDVSTCGRSEISRLSVVFIHGWGQSKIDMLIRRRPYDALARMLVMYDLRGHGEATGGLSRVGWREEEDLIALLQRLGGGRCILVGHSMGGVIALRAAAALHRRPAKGIEIAGVVLHGPYTATVVPLRNRLRALGQPTWIIPDVALLIMRLFGVRDVQTLSAAAAVSAPVLILHGENDEIVSLDEVKRIANAIPGARITVLDGAGHSDAHEQAQHEHDEAVRQFLCGNTSATGG